MTELDANPQPPATAPTHTAESLAATPEIRSAARWFWWIAGLSLVNTVLAMSGTQTQMVVGLGLTLASDVAFGATSPIGFVIDAAALGFFLLMGQQAQRGRLWAFYLGVVVYSLDALIYVLLQDWMPVALHVLVIYFIVRGVLALRKGLAQLPA